MSLLLYCSVLLVILTAAKAQLSFNESTENRINVIVVLNDSNAGSFCTSEAEKLPSFSRLKSVDPNLEDRMEKQIKENILAKLGLSFPTNLSCPSGPPAFSVDHYKRVRNMIKPYLFKNGRDLPKYKYTVIFPIIVKSPSSESSFSSTLMTFKFPLNFTTDDIVTADLWFLNGNYRKHDNFFEMVVSEVDQNKRSRYPKRLIALNIYVEGGVWHKVPVLLNVKNWTSGTYQLEISCRYCEKSVLPLNVTEDSYPFILVRRNTSSIEVEESHFGMFEECQRRRTLINILNECKWPITIDFTTSLCKHWIVWPERFNTHYCNGFCSKEYEKFCPYPIITRKPNINLYPLQLSEMCCAPIISWPLEIIYLESPYIVVYENVPNIIIEECGCKLLPY